MGDEFQAGICSGNWWNSSRSGLSVRSCSSPCSTALNDIGSLGWASETRSSCEETTASVSDSSMVFQQTQKRSQGPDSVGSGGGASGGGDGGGGGGGNILMDPTTLQMMGFGPSSLTMDWNQALLRGNGRSAETTFHSMLQDELSSGPKMESPPQTHQVQKEWSPKTSFSDGGEDSSTLNPFNKQVFPALDQQHQHQHQQQRLSPSSGDSTVSNQVMVSSFPSFPCNSASLLQGLFDQQEPQLQLQQHQQSSFDTTNPSPNYHINAGEFASPLLSQSLAWTKFPAYLRTSQPKQQQHQPQLHFSNNTPYWNASTAPMNDARSSFFPTSHTQFLSPAFDEKPSCSSLMALSTVKSGTMEVRDSGSVAKKVSTEPVYKRPRIETPSPLPTFKVRKEKLGDRITALQQLVSPFGKTDTASVLFEAIEYIKFLHDQVSVLSTPYMKNGAPTQHQQNSDKSKDGEEHKQDLRTRGLCLVPISSTFPVTNETAADFWTPTFGGSYR